MATKMRIGASVSCFDLFNLERQFEQVHAAPIDFLHYDVVDGRFARCFILGLPLLEAIRPHTALPIEVHLAAYEPDLYVEQLISAGADIITVHWEAETDPAVTFELIRSCGARPALGLRSETEPAPEMLPLLADAVYVIKLTVHPGFAGQPIQPAAFAKMAALRQLMDAHGIDTPIVADGNVNQQTIPTLVDHGATMFVGGTSGLFRQGRSVRESAEVMLQAAGL